MTLAVRMVRVLCLALIALAPAAARAADPPTWMVDGQGRRFRVRFDPGHRLYAGLGAAVGPTQVEPVAELGLHVRNDPPAATAEVFWKRDHELLRLRLRRGGDGMGLEGRLYHAVFLRHSREGSLTIPTTPPLRLALPFDVGVRVELGRLAGTVPLSSTGAALEAGVVRGEALADFLRSEQPGRWLAIGAVGYYDVRLQRQAGGPLSRDHRVMPLTAACAWARGETTGGLLAAGLRAEYGRAWSSQRGWGQALRVEGELEVTPIALNDLPLSLIVSATVERGNNTPDGATRLRTFAGVRLGAPLSAE